jgi:CRP/FNR family transcriptional regulator
MASSNSNHIPEPCASCPVRAFAFYGLCREDDAARICGLRKGNSLRLKGRSIYRAGDTREEVYTLLDGWAFRFILLPDGRRQILSFLLPGDAVLFPLMYRKRLPYSIEALTSVSLCTFDSGEMSDLLARSPFLARQFESACVNELASLDGRLTDLGRRTADERMAHFLLSVYDRLKKRGYAVGQSVPFPLRLHHLADALGLTATHVSRMLAALRQQGLISLSQSRLTVHDEDELATIAMVSASSL